jgi:hypothetical protein
MHRFACMVGTGAICAWPISFEASAWAQGSSPAKQKPAKCGLFAAPDKTSVQVVTAIGWASGDKAAFLTLDFLPR